MNYNSTLKNWRWWVVLPLALPIFVVLCIPRLIILILSAIIGLVNFFNVGDNCSFTFMKNINKWVHGDL